MTVKIRAEFNILSIFLHMPWYFREKRNLKKYILIFATNIKCVTLLDEEVALYTKTRKGQTFAPCVTLWYFSPPSAFSLFSSSWPIYSSLMANIHNKNKCASHCLLFTKNGAHVSFPVEQGEKYFCICDSSTNTPPALLPPISLFPSPSLVFTFPLLKREMRGGSQDNWPCVSWAVWSRNAVEATHLRAAQQTVKCSTGGRTWLQRERGTRAV